MGTLFGDTFHGICSRTNFRVGPWSWCDSGSCESIKFGMGMGITPSCVLRFLPFRLLRRMFSGLSHFKAGGQE